MDKNIANATIIQRKEPQPTGRDMSKIYSQILEHIGDEERLQRSLRSADLSTLEEDITIQIDMETCKDCIGCFEGLETINTTLKWITQGHCCHWNPENKERKTTKCGVKLIHLLAAFGAISTLKLLKMKGVSLKATTYKFKYTALHIAIINGRDDNVEFLASEGIDVNEKCLYQGNAWLTPFAIAALKAHIKILKILNRFGANLTKELHRIIQTGDIVPIESLIKAGADVNASVDTMCTTPLHIAIKLDSIELINILLENGADVLARDKRGATPVHAALSGCHERSGEVLIKELTRNHPKWLHISHLAHDAIRGNSIMLLQKLMNASIIDINEVNSDGNTLLHIASEKGFIDIVNFLIENDCELNPVNVDGATPVGMAVCKCKTEIVKLLIVAGAEVDKGGFPLKFIQRKHPSLCQQINGSLLFGALFHNSIYMTHLLFEAGLNFHKLEWLPTFLKMYDTDASLKQYIQNIMWRPETFQKLCRNVIRRHYGRKLSKLSNCDVTKIMKEYLLMEFI